MRLPRLILNQKLCLILFAAGAAVSVILELLGIKAMTTADFIPAAAHLQVSPYIALPVVYAVAAAAAGFMTKRNGNAPVYGACLGQFQLLMPIILLFILRDGSAFDAIWRSLCGLPLTASVAGAAYSIKKLILHR